MPTEFETPKPHASSRARVTHFFLWISVLAWGFLLGAKLFDLRVLVGAWSASPPESLSLLPYGARYPVDTGEFFIPSSAALLVASCGALASGWKTPLRYRSLLLASVAAIFGTLIFTVLFFWPLNAALWAIAQGSAGATQDPATIQAMVREWVAFDWMRLAVGSVGYVASIRAISIPFPAAVVRARASLALRIAYAVCTGALLLFVSYFLAMGLQ